MNTSCGRSVCIYRYRIPLCRPLQLNGNSLQQRQGLIVQLNHGSGEQFGEIAPLPGFSRESLAEAEAELLRSARLWLAGRRITPSFPSVAFGLDCARFVSPSRRLLSQDDSPHARPCAGHTVAAIPLLSGSPDAIQKRLSELTATASPPRLIKLKVARLALDDEITLVQQILRDHPDLRLRLDANRGWSWQQALQFARAVPASAIDYIEEPLDNPDMLPDWFAHSGLYYALDETVQQPGYRFHKHSGLKALVIKPTLVGSWLRIRQLLNAAHSAGIIAVLSSSYESSLGLHHLARLARCWTPGQPPGLDTHQILSHDLLWRWPDSAANKPVLSLKQLKLIAQLESTSCMPR